MRITLAIKLSRVVSFVLIALPILAQSNNGVGFPSFGSFAQHGFDTVNEGNLDLHLEIPVVTKSGRGIPLSYVISYDSVNWTPSMDPVSGVFYWSFVTDNGGWRTLAQPIAGYVTYTQFLEPPQTCPNGRSFVIRQNYTYHDANGTNHFIGGQAVEADCNGVPHGFPATMARNNSGYSLAVDSSLAVSVITVGGTLIHPPQKNGGTFVQGGSSANPQFPGLITDTNGNQVTGAYTDTLGVLAVKTSSVVGVSDSVTYPSPTNSSTYLGATLNYSPATLQSNFGCAGINDLGTFSTHLITSVVMPDNTSYTITYEPTPGHPTSTTGRVKSITLPSGGQITYQYTGTNNGIICADGSPAGLTRTTPDGVWTYTRTVTQQGFALHVPGYVTSSSTTLIDPLGNKQVINFGAMNGSSPGYFEKMRQVYTGSSTLLKTMETCYNGAAFPCTSTVAPGPAFTRKTVRDEIPNSSGKVSQVDTSYLGTGLVTDVYDYDFGSAAPGLLMRHTQTSYNTLTGNIFYDPSNPSTSYQVTLYNRPASVSVYDGSSPTPNLLSRTAYAYDETTPSTTSGTPQHVQVTGSRGNPTMITYLVQGSTTLNKTKSYFDTGTTNVETEVGGRTPHTYTYGTGSCGNSFPTKITDALGFFKTFTWDCNGGLSTGVTDENIQPTTSVYGDPNFWRLTQTSYPDGGQTNYTYNLGTTTPWNTIKSLKISSTQTLTKKTVYDSLARVSQNQMTSDPQGTDYVNITYDADGHLKSTSNPYRTTSDSTYGVTTNTTFDGLGRVTVQTQPDSTTVQTSYSSNCATATDEAGKTRKSCSDGLGHLVQVFEDPGISPHLNYETDYQYDALGNLICAVQKGTDTNPFTTCAAAPAAWRPRSFTYDGLSRLLTAYNPEAGTVTYKYDSDAACPALGSFPGLLVSKLDARGIRTCMQYDAKNRLTQKSYTDGITPTVQYGYDGIALTGCATTPPTLSPVDANPVTYRTSMCDGSGATAWSHDAMGRALKEQRIIKGTSALNKATKYTYYLDGELNTLVYPGVARTITYTPDAAGRLVSAVDAANGINYVTNATYSPQGALASLTMGGTISGAFSYTSRLQPLQIYYGTNAPPDITGASCPGAVGNIMHRIYDFGLGTGDNGNVNRITNCRDSNRTESFTYDSLNRIVTAATQGTTCAACWGFQYGHMNGSTFVPGIDPWGNLFEITLTQGSGTTLSQTPSSKNQFAMTYDASGNLTNDGGGHTYTYDAESRIITTAGYTYVYDGDGKRVKKCSNAGCTSGTVYWTGIEDSILSESGVGGSIQEEYIFFGGARIARREPAGTVHYYFADHLGSANVIASNTGSIQKETDYTPHGGEVLVAGSDTNHYKFTGKERDSESGLDNFGARYDASSMGRFMTPDPLPWLDWQHGNREERQHFAEFISNPQNFNMYAYVDNNPTTKTDPTGMEGCKAGDKTFSTCTIKIVYDPKTSKGTLTVTGQNKGDKDPTVLLTSSVVVGGNGHVTPTGTFTATVWEKDHVSTKYGSAADTPYSKTVLGGNAFGPYQLHMKELDSQGIYIHGTMGPSWSPTTWGNSIFLSPTSHGCVRMCNRDDVALHDMMPNPGGNKVIISTKPEDPED
jgi:RHS repeat-associated protein